jgi:hypothetical protein
MALEAMAEDVGQKVGEMERFMDVSRNFMDSIDLQNGVFEEEGLAMLENGRKRVFPFCLAARKQTHLQQQSGQSGCANART